MQTPYDPEVILRNTERLRRLARTLVHDEHLAEDLVQEAWVAAVRRPPRHEGALPSWLARVVRNLAVSHRRRAEARERREEKAALPELGQADPEEALERFEVLKTVVDLVSGLEEPGRSTIILHFFEGLNMHEVAERQDVSYGAVRLRVQQALERLRLRLDRRLGSRSAWVLALTSLLAGRDACAAAGVAASAAPGAALSRFLGGLVSMSAKKVALSVTASVAALIGLVGLWSIVWLAPLAREEGGGAAAGGASPEAGRGASRPGPLAAGSAAGRPERIPPGASPPSIQGRVTSAGSAVASARVIALPLERWSAVARAGSEEPDLETRLDRMGEAYRREAASCAEARSGEEGTFDFRGLPPGDYRLLVSHPDHLPSPDTVVTVAAGATAASEIELAAASSIAGRVVDEEGRPVPGARVEAEPAEAAALRGRERDLRRLLEWEEGLALLDGARRDSGSDGSFLLTSLPPALHAVRVSHPAYLEAEVLMAQPGAPVLVTLRRGGWLTGRVLDPDTRPVAGARVSLRLLPVTEVHRMFDWTGSERDATERRTQEVGTGEDGRFRLGGLAACPHVISVAAASMAPLFREVEGQGKDLDLGDLVLSRPLAIAGRVLEPDGRPAARARVWAGRPERTVQAANQIVPDLPPPVAEALTGEEGAFVLAGLPPGSFLVRAEAEGFAEAVVQSAPAGTQDLVLALGVGITVHGKVVDAETSAPVSGAQVKVGFRRLRTAESDARGEFLIRGLSPEEVHYGGSIVRASHPEYGPHVENGAVVICRDERSPLLIPLLRAGFEIEGRVVDVHGRPVASAAVWLETSGPEGGFTLPGDRTFTDAAGAFRFEEPIWLRHNASLLKLDIAACHPAHASGRVGSLDLPGTGERWPVLEIVLGQGAVLEGKVTGEAGEPVGGARISVRRVEEGTGSRPAGQPLGSRAAYTAKDGSYRVAGLDPGPAEAVVAALGYATRRVTGLAIDPPSTRIDFALGRGASISGRVLDSEGAPLAGIEVTALAEDAARQDIPTEFGQRLEQRTRTGLVLARTAEDGRYELAHLVEGSYTVVARASGYEAAQAPGVRAGEQVSDIVLARFSAVRGQVMAAETGLPLTRFTINAIDKARRSAEGPEADWRVGSQGELTFDDPLGRFLYDGLRPGEYEVIVTARGLLAFHADVKLRAGEEVQVEARLKRGGTIGGMVLVAGTGRPIARAHLSFCRQAPPEEREAARKKKGLQRATFPPPSGTGDTSSGEDGSFLLEGLLEGEYSIVVRHPFHAGPAAMTRLAPGGVARVELWLQPTGRLEGTIAGLRRTDGQRRLHQRLEFERLGEEGDDGYRSEDEWGVAVDAAGRFRAQGLSPGRYRLILKQQEYRLGKFTETGPGSGLRDLKQVGPAATVPLGEVEVLPGRTTFFQGSAEGKLEKGKPDGD